MLDTVRLFSEKVTIMNIGIPSTIFNGTPIYDDGTTSLQEAQDEALSTAPDSPVLKWRRLPSEHRVPVASLLPTTFLPLNDTDRKRAHASAIYYSECFLNGVTPNDADHAASKIQQQYKRWWLTGTVSDEPTKQETNAAVQGERSGHGFQQKRTLPLVSDDSVDEYEQSSKRRRRRSLRAVINNVTLFGRHGSHGRNSMAQSAIAASSLTARDNLGFHSNVDQPSVIREQICHVRDTVIAHMKSSGGDLDNDLFGSQLEILHSYYLLSNCDVGKPDAPFEVDGTWLTLSKPTFTECMGFNDAGDHIYALGRMSFDMFRPTGLRCSIQGNFNTVHRLHGEVPHSVPRSLRKAILNNKNCGVMGLRTYNIVVAFTIEPNQTRSGQLVPVNGTSSDFVLRKPIRGIMTNFGYAIPDPNAPNRLSIWFTGGQLEVNDEVNDLEDWQRIFAIGGAPKRDMKEFARVLAAKVLLGADIPDTMDDKGNMKYSLKRPIGGHGSAFCDVLYIDDKLRIMRGHHGAMFVFCKVGGS